LFRMSGTAKMRVSAPLMVLLMLHAGVTGTVPSYPL
jgi:hypothetical protein